MLAEDEREQRSFQRVSLALDLPEPVSPNVGVLWSVDYEALLRQARSVAMVCVMVRAGLDELRGAPLKSVLRDHDRSALAWPEPLWNEQDAIGEYVLPCIKHHFVPREVRMIIDLARSWADWSVRIGQAANHLVPNVVAVEAGRPSPGINGRSIRRKPELCAPILRLLGELTISTHGRGEMVSGSVQVISNGPIGGVLRFDLPDIGVAGVGVSHPVRDVIFPARRRAGGISTTAAIRNLEAEAMEVSCQLMEAGAVLEEVAIPLEANGQDARFVEEMFTGTDTSAFVGSVRCMAPVQFTGVAVELDDDNRIFTTLPVVPVQR